MTPTAAATARLPGLDLLRAVAVLWTMQFHSFIVGGLGADWKWLERYGWMGVCGVTWWPALKASRA